MNAVTTAVELAGAWCVTAAGSGPAAALGAVADQVSALRPHPTLACPDDTSGKAIAVMYAPWEGLHEALPLQQRIIELVETLCSDMTADSGAVPPGQGKVILMLPPVGSARSRQLDPVAIARALSDSLPAAKATGVQVAAVEQGAMTVLLREMDNVSTGKVDWVMLGAVDSLIDPVTMLDMLQQQRLQLKGKGGIAPGEAAAFVLLRRAAAGDRGGKVLLKAAAIKEEPHDGRADEAAMRGLGDAIRAACTQAGFRIDQCEHVFADLRSDTEGELEWWQTTKALWTVTIPERYRKAVALGVVSAPEPVNNIPPLTRISDAFGDTGVAALVVQLALAGEWQRFSGRWSRFGLDASQQRWLVCETGCGKVRGALCIETE